MSVTQRLLEKIVTAVTVAGEETRASIAAGLGETRNALRIDAARAAQVYPNTMLNGGRCRVVGWSVRETTGSAPATVTLYDSRDGSGDVVATWNVPSGSASNHGIPGPGVTATEALFVAVTGAVSGAVDLGVVD